MTEEKNGNGHKLEAEVVNDLLTALHKRDQDHLASKMDFIDVTLSRIGHLDFGEDVRKFRQLTEKSPEEEELPQEAQTVLSKWQNGNLPELFLEYWQIVDELEKFTT